MPRLLNKLNTRLILWVLGGLLAAGLLILIVLIALHPEPQMQTDLETTAPTPASLDKNPYSPEDFVLDEAGFMTCLAADYRLGIDVSGHQGEIDWDAVKNAGVEFVFIRVGNRGTTEGKLYPDGFAQNYYEGAKKAGLSVGAYFFSQAITPQEARDEAWFVLEQVKNWELDLPVVYDWEWVGDDARTANMDAPLLTQCTRAFCEIVASAGLSPMIYFNYTQGMELLELEQLSEYDFWLALYEPAIQFPYQVDCWQYSCEGSVPGIEGNVDLNLYLPAVAEE